MSAYWIHGANVLYLASYLVRDILALRVLTVVAGLALLPFYILRADPIWVAVAWNALFIAINLLQIYRLLLERRPVRFTSPELALYRQVFAVTMMSERNFMKLLKTGRWEKASAERCILKEGAKVSDLIVLCKGSVEIRVGEGSGKEVARLDAGRFVGEMSYVTTEPASASVWTSEPTEYVAWAREALDRLFAANPEVRNGIQLAIGADLAKKVRHR